MPFDMNTAKPVSSGFDINTAKPVIDTQKRYIYTPPKSPDHDETIQFPNGESVKAPYGTSAVVADIMQDDLFDTPISTMQETAAQFEKQAALYALVFNAYDMVPDSDVATFAADRNKAWASAQKRQPEYMKKFTREWDESKGFFQGAGVVLDNLRAVGRIAITQSPNSAAPLLSSAAEAKIGGKVGAKIGARFAPVQAKPVAAAAGGVAGAATGAIAGTFKGSLFQEVGSQIDEIMTSDGIDTSDADQLLAALSNNDYMKDVRSKAERKGLTTAAVEAMFQVIGGRVVKNMAQASLARKAAKGVGALATESTGEFIGEAAGQAAREKNIGKVDWKDAALEGIVGLSTSVGQIGIETSIHGGKAAAKAVSKPAQAPPLPEIQQDVTEESAAAIEQESLDISIAKESGVIAPAESGKIVSDFMAGKELNVSGFDDAQQSAVQRIIDKAKPVRDRIVKGRLNKLDSDVETVLGELDAVEYELETARMEISSAQEEDGWTAGKQSQADNRINRLETKAQELASKWESLDRERGELTTIEDFSTETADLLGKDITVKGRVIEGLGEQVTKQSVRATTRAFRESRTATMSDVKQVQKTLTDAIKKSGLNKSEQSDFINTIVGIQSVEKLKKQIPKIQRRIESKLAKRLRKDTLDAIKNKLSKVKGSNIIAVDFVKQIESLVSGVDTKRRSESEIREMQNTLDYMQKNPDASMPKDVIRRLDNLNRRRIEDVQTTELIDILEDMVRLTEQGKTKLALMQQRRKHVMQGRLEELERDSVKLSNRPVKRAGIGERLSVMDEVRNKYTAAVNAASSKNLFINGMDVIFDVMDGAKNYTGANHRIFKQTIDRSFGKYLDLKESTTREVKELSDSLDLDDKNFERIGVYAAAVQENGVDKLLNTGISQAEIDRIVNDGLTENEMKMYNLMREKLDAMKPMLREVMRVTYNKDFVDVDDYFPFLTDFDAMATSEIHEMFGDDAPIHAVKKKNVKKDFTKKRTGGKQKIRLDAMNVFLSHVDNAAYLVEMGADIRDLSDLASSQEFQDAAGDVGQEIVIDWLDLLARKGNVPGDNDFMNALRKNAGAAMLAAKLSTVLIQPTALADGAALVGGSYVSRGIKNVANKEWRQFMHDNMPEFRARIADDPAYLNMGGDGIIGKAQEAGFWAIKNVDKLSAGAVASGAYTRYVEEHGGVVDLDNPDQDALDYAQLMMRRTQSSSFFKDVPPVLSQGKLTGQVALDKLILQFQSFVLNRFSIIRHDMVKTGIGRGQTAQALNIATWLLLANMAELGIRRGSKELLAMIFGGEMEPWEETYKEEAIRTLIGNVPFVGGIVTSMDYGKVPVPAIALLTDALTEVGYAVGSEENRLKHSLQAAALGAGIIYGVPGMLQTKQIIGDVMSDDSSKGGF